MKLKILLIVSLFVLLSSMALTSFAAVGDYVVVLKEEYTSDSVVLEYLEPLWEDARIYILKDNSKLEFVRPYAESIEKDEVVDVIFEEPDPVLMTEPADQYFNKQWNHAMINVQASRDIENYGEGVKVGVIDSGVNNHSDFEGRVLTGREYFTNTTNVTDNHGHGTHVSGIIAAGMNDIGVCGVAPKAYIVPLKAFDAGKSTTYEMLSQAIKDAVDHFDCDIINMSFGTKSNVFSLRTAINYAAQKGVIIVASAGNAEGGETPDKISYPAYYDAVISVASVTSAGTRASYSYYNSGVTVAAPGSSIYSTSRTGSYLLMTGTSQAAPHVAGLAALALSINPNLTPNEFAVILTSTCTDKGDEGYDTHYGYGLVNAGAMAEKVMETVPLYVSPINTAYGKSAFYIKNNSDTDINATSIFVRHEESKLTGVEDTHISLSKGEGIRIEADFECSNHFWWKSLQNPVPLEAFKSVYSQQ